LEALRLDQNMLAGTLSTRLGDLTELMDLRLGENEFSGTLPPQVARLSNLRKCVGEILHHVCNVFYFDQSQQFLVILSFPSQKSCLLTTPTWKA